MRVRAQQPRVMGDEQVRGFSFENMGVYDTEAFSTLGSLVSISISVYTSYTSFWQYALRKLTEVHPPSLL